LAPDPTRDLTAFPDSLTVLGEWMGPQERGKGREGKGKEGRKGEKGRGGAEEGKGREGERRVGDGRGRGGAEDECCLNTLPRPFCSLPP